MSRILHILGSGRAEGTPRLGLDWLSVGTHRQAVVLLSPEFPDLQDELRKGSAEFFVGDVRLAEKGRMRRRATSAIVSQACRNFKPDVVVCWPTWAAGAVGSALRGQGARPSLIVHCGNPADQSTREKVVSDLRFWPAYRVNGYFACCSDYVRDSFRQRTLFMKGRFQTVPNCVQTERVAVRSAQARRTRVRGKTRFIMVGTMEAHKDQATLVHAAALIGQQRRDFELQLVGGGTLLDRIRALVVELKVSDLVATPGVRSDIPELLGQSDAFVFSTTPQEGFGTVFIEALAAGLPVIASDVPACREALGQGSFGRLVPPRDPRAWAAVLSDFLEHPEGSRADPQRLDSYLLRFSPQAMIDAYLALAV